MACTLFSTKVYGVSRLEEVHMLVLCVELPAMVEPHTMHGLILNGCLTHMNTAPKCIGTLLLENPLYARGKSLIPTVASLLTELSPEKQARDWLPPTTILYMAPGGHRQWPVSIKPMLDRLSWIVLMTRPLALVRFREALSAHTNWIPTYRQCPRIQTVPAVPYKFLDIGTKMGEYHIEDLDLKRSDKENILHPRYTRSGIPPARYLPLCSPKQGWRAVWDHP